MLRTLALRALLCASTGSVAVAQGKPTREDVFQAYVKALEDLAGMRVEQQNCVGDVTSTVRDTTEMVLNWGEQFVEMPRSKSIDIVNDKQIFFRALTNRQCRDNGKLRGQFFVSADRFLKTSIAHRDER